MINAYCSSQILQVYYGGVDIKSVNVGGMSFKEGKRQITNAVSVDDKDVESFKKLSEKGIEIEFRKVDTDKRINLMEIIK